MGWRIAVATVSEKSFEEALLEKTDQVLLSIGENIRTIIYHHIHEISGLDKREIPQKPAVFSSTLKLLFGNNSEIIEKRIIKNLCLEFEIPYDDTQKPFASHLEDIENRLKVQKD